MKTQIRTLFLSATLAWFFTLSFAAFAQEKPAAPAAPPPEQAPAVTATTPAHATPAPAAEAAKPAEPAGSGDPALQPAAPAKPELRRLDTESPAPAGKPKGKRHVYGYTKEHNSGNELVSVGHDSHLAKGEKADAVVSVFGSSNAEGDVADAVVSVLGNSRATGTVGNDVVSVLGSTYVNCKIGGAAVAVLGNVEIGPEAEIGGDVVAVGGSVKRDPKAVIHGQVNNVSFGGHFANMDGLRAWFEQCVLYARPLAIGPHLAWAWCIALSFLALYVVLALLFSRGVDRCIATLEERPGRSVLAAVLTLLLAPVLVVLLCITVIGLVLVPFVVAGLFFAALFGKAVMLAWLGRRVIRLIANGAVAHAALATLVGGAIVLGLYLVPVLGFIVYKLVGVLGLGVVVYTLLLGLRSDKPAATPPVIPPVVPVGAAPGEAAAAAPTATAASTPPALVSAVTLPRAGFWIRVAASLLDLLLVAIAVKVLPEMLRPNLPLVLAAYCVVLWTLKGTTIGGIVCNLKVVRLDDRPIDWVTAIVRALGAFLSLVVAGLGFIWVAFDDQRQSWHDKIAGTTVVIVPKGTPLV